ncbi:MAG: flagellin [Solirubrobacteraceae bacterium]|jgi:flagellin|nr:flagellin [Solirubrobacteraceae bacterium]
MSLRINNNVEAFNTHRQLVANSEKMAKSMERLSSGYRINRAADDAAGLAISEKMRGQITGLSQAQRNAQDGVSLVQTGEGALNEVHSMLQRVRELRTQFGNDTLSDTDKKAIVSEVGQLGKEISDIRTNTKFNGIALFQGDIDGAPVVTGTGSASAVVGGGGSASTINLQVGANDGETITISTSDLTASATSLSKITSIDASSSAAVADFAAVKLDDIDKAIAEVSDTRATFGSVQNRLEHRIANLASYQENLVSAESRIRDVDMADEMVQFTKSQILQQAGTSMLSQANQAPQSVLSLLR